MFPREHEFTALVMDCGLRRYLAAISLRGESNNLESRIERVSGMYFFEKLAGPLGKPDEHVSYVLRKERCSGCREREYLQPCQAKDLTIGSRSELLARCADVACPSRPRVISGGIAITQGFRFLSATNSLRFRFCGAGKGTLGIDPPSLVAVPIPGKY